MFVRWYRVAATLAGMLISALLHAQYTFPPRTHQDMEARLTVLAAKETPERGRGEATLTLTISGPATLEVEPPRLEDAAAAWKEERQARTREVQGKRVVWQQVIRLQQIKPGLEPLADLSVRFRREPDADWVEEKWTDILRHVRIPPAQLPIEVTPSWMRRWGFVLILAATGLLGFVAWLARHRKIRREPALPPDQWALQEIERAEATLSPPLGEAEAFHTQISFVTRRYLAERFGMHALQQTTAEFLEAVRHAPATPADEPMLLHQGNLTDLHPPLSGEQQTLLIDLFERCDLAKFARFITAPEECRRTAELARDFVRQTSKEREGRKSPSKV
jgi:hypothetical protein